TSVGYRLRYNQGVDKWSRNGPETVLFWSRRVGAGDVHSRQDRAEPLVERILRSAKALHPQQEGEHDACPEHTPYRSIRCPSPQGGPQDRSGSPHVLAHRLGGGGRGIHRRDRHVHHDVAVRPVVASGPVATALPADDPGRLRDAGGLSADGQPLAHVSLIRFTVWSSVVHAGIMGVQALAHTDHRGHLWGDVPTLFLVAAVLALLLPRGAAAKSAS